MRPSVSMQPLDAHPPANEIAIDIEIPETEENEENRNHQQAVWLSIVLGVTAFIVFNKLLWPSDSEISFNYVIWLVFLKVFLI